MARILKQIGHFFPSRVKFTKCSTVGAEERLTKGKSIMGHNRQCRCHGGYPRRRKKEDKKGFMLEDHYKDLGQLLIHLSMKDRKLPLHSISPFLEYGQN